MFQDELELQYTQVGQNIIEWTKENISSDFEFRENQLEIIHSIISNIIDGEHSVPTHIVEAPTGSGKSLILIISAGVLAEYYNLDSYILCSDLSLWKQYDDFIKSTPEINKKFGRIKGQNGNYECGRNHRSVSSGECRIAKISWEKLMNPYKAKELKFECAKYCPYIKARKKAIESKVTLMTYQLYMRAVSTQPKDNYEIKGNFRRRPVIFCDECHNIPNIVQSAFGLTIKESYIENLLHIWKYGMTFENTLFNDELTDKVLSQAKSVAFDEKELVDRYQTYFNILKDSGNPKDTLEALINLTKLYERVQKIGELIQDMFCNSINNKDYIQKEHLQVYEKCEWLDKILQSIHYYTNIYSEENISGIDSKYLVKNLTENLYEEDIFGQKKKAKYPWIITLGCALENFLVQGYFLSSSMYQVMTSATIGGHYTFVENCGIESNHLYDVLPSTFDFSKSPIYFLSRWKMSKALRDKNFPYIKSAIYELCNRFDDKKGIIQTHTYENAKEIYNDAPEELQSRMLLYSGTSAKQELIEYHKETEVPTILIGPTLAEGVDLPGDECRFIIMMKMPYPYIGDNLVKAKMELFPDWYDAETAKMVIQAIGRGNRYHDDWCLTYILDGCFNNLFAKTKDEFPMNIKERLKFYA